MGKVSGLKNNSDAFIGGMMQILFATTDKIFGLPVGTIGNAESITGKDLVYDVEVVEIIEDDVEKVRSMIKLHYSYPNMDLDNAEIEIKDKVCNIKLEEISKFDQKSYMDITFARFRIAKDVWDNMDVEKVNFVDEFEKKAPEADEEAEEE